MQRLAVLLAALPALAIAGAGCGEESPDLANGKDLFVEKCGSCHALARASTTGVVGPDLDEAFGPSRRQGLGEGTFEGVVLNQIANVLSGSEMPADLVTGQDARDVAAYVAEVAGEPGEDEGALASAGQPEVSNKPIAASGGTLEMPASPTGALAFASTAATSGAGALEIVSANDASVPHNIALSGPGGLLAEGDVVEAGGVSRIQVNLQPGKYEFLCTVPGHADGGMKGTLTVR